MRLLFLAVFLIVNLLGAKDCKAQTGTFLWTNGAPTTNPGASGARFAVDRNTYRWYEWVSGTTWVGSGDRIQNITGCSAPNYTPTIHQSWVVINNCDPGPELYAWNGTAWKILQPYTGTGAAGKVAYWTGAKSLASNSNFSFDGTNLGIGTASPSQKLHVRNGSLLIQNSSADFVGGFIESTSATLVANDRQYLSFGHLGGELGKIGGVWSGTTYDFFIDGYAGAFNRIATFKGTGRVGIGTTSPAQLFHVEGSARITGNAGTGTSVMLRDANGDISNATLGMGIGITSGTLSATVTVWTTATRPTPSGGTFPIGFNTTTGKHEGWNGSEWNEFYETVNTIEASATLDFPSTGAHSSSDLTVTITGAAVGDVVTVAPGIAAILTNSNYTAWVSASNTVTIRFNHYGSGGGTNPLSAQFNIIVTKF